MLGRGRSGPPLQSRNGLAQEVGGGGKPLHYTCHGTSFFPRRFHHVLRQNQPPGVLNLVFGTLAHKWACLSRCPRVSTLFGSGPQTRGIIHSLREARRNSREATTRNLNLQVAGWLIYLDAIYYQSPYSGESSPLSEQLLGLC